MNPSTHDSVSIRANSTSCDCWPFRRCGIVTGGDLNGSPPGVSGRLVNQLRSTISQRAHSDNRKSPSACEYLCRSLVGGHAQRWLILTPVTDVQLDSPILLKKAKAVPSGCGLMDKHVFSGTAKGRQTRNPCRC